MITLELNQRDTCENNIRIFFQEANSYKIDYQVLLVSYNIAQRLIVKVL